MYPIMKQKITVRTSQRIYEGLQRVAERLEMTTSNLLRLQFERILEKYEESDDD